MGRPSIPCAVAPVPRSTSMTATSRSVATTIITTAPPPDELWTRKKSSATSRRGDPRRSACKVCPSPRHVHGHLTHRTPGRAFRSRCGRFRTGSPRRPRRSGSMRDTFEQQFFRVHRRPSGHTALRPRRQRVIRLQRVARASGSRIALGTPNRLRHRHRHRCLASVRCVVQCAANDKISSVWPSSTSAGATS